MNAEIAPYHWDDRKKLHQDYVYLIDLYEELLEELTKKLNELHAVQHSVRYWRIIVGPWLGYFVQIVFDRWFMVKEVIKKNQITSVNCIQTSNKSFIPNDMEAFEKMMVEDYWNEYIYSKLLEFFKVPIKKVQKIMRKPLNQNVEKKILVFSKSKRLLAFFINRLSMSLCRKDEHFLIKTFMQPWQEILLQLKLGQTPKKWSFKQTALAEVNSSLRKWALNKSLNKNNFSEIIRLMIPQHIPICYLEGYKNNVALTKSLSWPKQPKSIFTSNSHVSNDIFKIWAAEKVENGAPYFIGQHGGSFGVAKWIFFEEHEIKTSDAYLTFGWQRSDKSKIFAVGNIKETDKPIKRKRPKIALMAAMSMPRYSYWLYSVPVAAGQWQSYFSDLISFVKNCSKNVKDYLLVRLYSQDYGNNQKERWAAACPEIRLDSGKQPMRNLLKKTRIYISTYNATTYLESLYHNIPTLIFWNPNHWEIRDEAMPYFELLEKVGIFHKSPSSAANHLNRIWEHLEEWWQRHEVQEARAKFCNRFSRNNGALVESIANVLQKIEKKY